MNIIGRHFEQTELRRIYESNTSEFVMIYGRRRVGKTYLIREFFKNKFDFCFTGMAKGTRKEQLLNFRAALSNYDEKVSQKTPDNWVEACSLLIELLEKSSSKRKVVFLDELPWIDTPKSDFLRALEHFWNTWASVRNDIVLIVCGSAASWLVKNIVRNHGGLHNRLTYKIKLNPFSLAECKSYMESQGIKWDYRTIAECYMILGGIPYYLKMLDKRLSLAQNIDRLFFVEAPLLEDEFDNLYASLFKKSEEYVKIIEVLAKKKSGYTREEILKQTKVSDGGSFTRRLEELEQCCFIRKYKSVGESKYLFQLIDFYSLFYFNFIKKGKVYDSENWIHFVGTPGYNAWLGLSFERLCLTHIKQVKVALGISGVSTQTYSYCSKSSQIDMIIERGDKVINLCEMKFVEDEFVITKSYSEKLNTKVADFRQSLKRQKPIYLTMITVKGVKQNEYSVNLVQNEVLLADLFKC